MNHRHLLLFNPQDMLGKTTSNLSGSLNSSESIGFEKSIDLRLRD